MLSRVDVEDVASGTHRAQQPTLLARVNLRGHEAIVVTERAPIKHDSNARRYVQVTSDDE
jgi:hypothetical protein